MPHNVRVPVCLLPAGTLEGKTELTKAPVSEDELYALPNPN
jgi:hypothetical protein